MKHKIEVRLRMGVMMYWKERQMKSALCVLIGFLLAALGVYTQAQDLAACAILVTTEARESLYVTLYRYPGATLDPVDELALPVNALVRLSSPYTDEFRLAVGRTSDAGAVTVDLYSGSISGFEYLERIPESEAFDVFVREMPWSHDGRYLLLRNVRDMRNNRLFVFDSETDTILRPTDIPEIMTVEWSPARDLFAFVGYRRIWDGGTLTETSRDFGVYISNPEATVSIRLPVRQDELARFHWLNEHELEVTSCVEGGCRATIYDVLSETSSTVSLGNLLLDGYIESLDSFLLSRMDDRNLFLLSRNGDLTQLSQVDRVSSRSLVSPNERYVAFRASVGERYALHVIDLADSFKEHVVELTEARPEILAPNTAETFPSLYGFYNQLDDWHPAENVLLYKDENAVYVFDPMIGASKMVMEDRDERRLWQPRWVCSP